MLQPAAYTSHDQAGKQERRARAVGDQAGRADGADVAFAVSTASPRSLALTLGSVSNATLSRSLSSARRDRRCTTLSPGKSQHLPARRMPGRLARH